MQPEDIDKLFRDRLQGHAPTPPAFIWAEIEAEIQPRRKRPAMWLAAAAVALLTLLGGAWWVLTGANPGGLGQPELAATTPRASVPATTPEIISNPQATTPSASPSSPIEAPADEPASVVATTEPSLETRSRGVQPDPAPVSRPLARPRASAPRHLALASSAAPQAPSVASATPTRPALTAQPQDPELERPTALPTATVASTGPIEVEVRSAAETPVMADANTARRPRLTSLIRQARNAVKGERVSLTDAGLPESVTVQARVAGHTLTKVIQL
ncbi:hypothetical protein [Hymenobacter tenuis]